MELKSRAKDGFRCKAEGRVLRIVGESPRGVYHGAMSFLETLGCGWYTPGEVGEVIPRRLTVSVADSLDHSEVSDSINRRLWYGGGGNRATGGGAALVPWRYHNKGYIECGSWSHAWAHLVSKDLFATKPELFAVKRGKRSPGQLCTANPETVRLSAASLEAQMAATPGQTVFPAGPNDGGGLCECAECARMQTPGYVEFTTGKPCYSDVIFKFASDIADVTSVKYPDKDLGILVYSEYSRPPVKLQTLNPRVFPMMAPIRRCRLHGPGNPICPSSQVYRDEILAWAKASNGKLGFYPYNYNLADSLFPFTKFDYFKRQIRVIREAGITQLAWIPETIDSWTTHAPHLYLCLRMLWRTDVDVDAELDRFFNGFYGQAAAPMRDYWLRIDRAYATTPTHTGSSYGQHNVWTPDLLQACRSDISRAQKLAANEREKQAVSMAEAGLRCAEFYMEVWNALGRFDFRKAETAQNELKAYIAARAAITNPPSWFQERYAWGYFETFVSRPVTAGARILADGGQILVKLPDLWKFQKDEHAVGASEGWWQPDYDDSAWKPLATFSGSWCDQGLDNYLGEGWYRVRFTVPAEARDGDCRLWFGGFDNNVDVYLNGQALGEKTGFMKPAEYTGLAGILKPGAENVLAVRVAAGSLAEVGTGGLMMPVMLYKVGTPGGGKDSAGKDVKYEM
jgi:hypothetical protein